MSSIQQVFSSLCKNCPHQKSKPKVMLMVWCLDGFDGLCVCKVQPAVFQRGEAVAHIRRFSPTSLSLPGWTANPGQHVFTERVLCLP